MKKTLLLNTLFVFYFQLCFSQSTPTDSLSINQKNKIHFGIYVMPSLSFNIGNKVFPPHEQGDWVYVSYDGLKEKDSIGYCIGFEIESQRIWENLSISLGVNLEMFSYSGTAKATYYDFPFKDPSGSAMVNYFYKDYYVDFPILFHYLLFIDKAKRLNVSLGGSGGLFMSETNSEGNDFYIEYYTNGVKHHNFTSFATTGIDYFYGKKVLLNLGFRMTSQLNTTPNGRRLAAVGIKIGIFY